MHHRIFIWLSVAFSSLCCSPTNAERPRNKLTLGSQRSNEYGSSANQTPSLSFETKRPDCLDEDWSLQYVYDSDDGRFHFTFCQHHSKDAFRYQGWDGKYPQAFVNDPVWYGWAFFAQTFDAEGGKKLSVARFTGHKGRATDIQSSKIIRREGITGDGFILPRFGKHDDYPRLYLEAKLDDSVAPPSMAIKVAEQEGVHKQDCPVYTLRQMFHRRGTGGCFPADAHVRLQDGSTRQMQNLHNKDTIAVGDLFRKTIRHERVLGDFHSYAHSAAAEYVMVSHDFGSLNLSASHFVATVERGFVPAEHVRVGESLLVRRGSSALLEPSRVLGLSFHVKLGLFAPFTFGGTLLVDGVLTSAYTADEFNLFISPSTRQKILARIGGYHGIHGLIHVLAFPLRLAYTLGLPGFFERCASVSIPGASGLHRLLTPNSTGEANRAENDLPAYVNYVGQTAGVILENLMWRV